MRSVTGMWKIEDQKYLFFQKINILEIEFYLEIDKNHNLYFIEINI